MSNRSESYIVTKDFDFVPVGILEEYALKSTKGINEEEGFNYHDVVEPPAPPRLLNKLLDINTWHKICVEAIASDASGAGYDLLPASNVENPSMEQKELIEGFFKSLRPNINTLLYQREYDCESVGWGVLEIIREPGNYDSHISDIKYYSAVNFRRCADNVRVQQIVGAKKRWFVIMGENQDENGHYDVHYLTGEKHYEGLPEHLRANELLWKNRFNPDTKLYGKAPATPAIAAMYADQSRAKYNIEFFANYGIPAMYVTITGDFDPGITDKDDPDYKVENTLQYKITEQLKQVIKNPHSAMVLQIPSEGEEGNVTVEIKPLSVETKEASFRLFRKDNRDEVVAAHHMDPNRVGITDAGKLGASNSEQTDNSYRVSTINPLVRDNEDDINYLLQKCLGVTDWVFKIVDTDDKKVEINIDKAVLLVERAIMTPNEAREAIGDKFGLARIENNPYLDEFYYNGTPISGMKREDNSIAGVDNILQGLEEKIGADLSDEQREDDDGEEIYSRFHKAIKSIRESW